DAIDALSSDFT
nr:Chain C, Calpastatin [Sus scrofa]1NX1_D Chain D, Calpastatin [Sus scrofa]